MSALHVATALLNATWQSLIAVAVAAAGLRLFPHTSARIRFSLWSMVLLFAAALPIANLAAQRTFVVAPAPPPAQHVTWYAIAPQPHGDPALQVSRAARDLRPVMPDRARSVELANAPQRLTLFSLVREKSPARPPRPGFVLPSVAVLQQISIAFLALYALVALYLLVRLSLRVVALYRVKRRCRPLSGPLASGALPRGARLAVSDDVGVPCVLGLFHPLIALPAELPVQAGESDLRCIVRHEAAHLERFDDWVGLGEQFVAALLFFNPAVHFATRRMAVEREIACDDHVVIGGGDRMSYAVCLASLAGRFAGLREIPAPGFCSSSRQIVVRVERLLDRAYDRSRRLRAGAFVTMLCVVATVFAALGRALPVPAQPAPASAPAPQKAPKAAPVPHTAAVPVARTAPAPKVADAPAPAAAPDGMTIVAPPNLSAAERKAWLKEVRAKISGIAPRAIRLRAKIKAKILTVKALQGRLIRTGMLKAKVLGQDLRATLSHDGKWIVTLPPGAAPLNALDMTKLKGLRGWNGPSILALKPKVKVLFERSKLDFKVMKAKQLAMLEAPLFSGKWMTGQLAPGETYVLRAPHAHAHLAERLAAQGVPQTPQVAPLAQPSGGSLIAALIDKGYGHPPVSQLVRLADHGVTADAIRGFAATGMERPSAEDLIRLVDHNVTPDYVARMRRLGVQIRCADCAIKLMDRGITPEQAAALIKAGARTDPDELIHFMETH